MENTSTAKAGSSTPRLAMISMISLWSVMIDNRPPTISTNGKPAAIPRMAIKASFSVRAYRVKSGINTGVKITMPMVLAMASARLSPEPGNPPSWPGAARCKPRYNANSMNSAISGTE
ncbi:hypothetical protein D3C80_1670160 [compost metagenome]